MMTMKILGARLLVSPLATATVSSGGIALPPRSIDENNVGGPRQFIVISKGTGLRRDTGEIDYRMCEIDVGDKVVCHSYTAGPIPFDSGDRRIIGIDEVIAIVKKETRP